MSAWFGRERAVAYGWMVAAGYLVLVVALNIMAGQQARDRVGVLATDYTGFHSGAIVLAERPAEQVFDADILAEAQRRALTERYAGQADPGQVAAVPLFHWRYPPPIFFIVRPLAELPAVVGYALWGALLLLPLLLAARRILPTALALPLTLAMPATFLNVMFGQNGALTAGLIGLGLAWSDRRPWLAGVAVGLLCYKPQFGLLFPVAFLAARNGRAFLSAGLTVAAVVAVSGLAFGWEAWSAFLASTGRSGGHLAEGNVAWTVMPTVYAALRLWLPDTPALAAQAAVSLAMAGLVAWQWRRAGAKETPGQRDSRLAAFCLATLLASPFAFVYDLALLTPALLWLGRDFVARGARPWQWAVLIAVALLPFYTGVLAKLLSLQVAPLAASCLLALASSRR